MVNSARAVPRQDDAMYLPQWRFFAEEGEAASGAEPPPLRVKKLLCLESIDRDWRDLVEAFGLEGYRVEETNAVIDGNFGVVERASDKKGDHTTRIDDATMSRLHRIYGMDFILWREHCMGKVKPQEQPSWAVSETAT